SGPGELEERFHELHERRYGYRADGEPVELVTTRLTALVPSEPPPLVAEEPSRPGEPRLRRARFHGEWIDTPVWQGAVPDRRLNGPTVVELPEATCVIPPGWSGQTDRTGTIVLERA